ncbi:MAG: terminase gpA endonuclease subunit [Pirellulales bacterium]
MTKAAQHYIRNREAAARKSRRQARSGRDCGPLPPVQNPRRKAAAARSLAIFAETYQPAAYYLAWGEAHRTAISKLEAAVRSGGLFAFAMPRGAGKSTLTETAALWAWLYGLCSYICVIGANAARGTERLDSIKTELETNPRLYEDFPEVCHPIRSLNRIPHRAPGQLLDGRPTRMTWSEGKIVAPSVAGSKASGAIMTVCGLEAKGIRGQSHKLDDGRTLRPTLAILDDPQTRESAYSETQCTRREELIRGDVLGMAGPTEGIAVVMPCTVIRHGDLADRLLDRDRNPDWQGERTEMVTAWPTNEGRWAEYGEIRADSLREHGDNRLGNAYYDEHREEMDAGGATSWDDRIEGDARTAIQSAWNLRLKLGDAAFFAEYQNQPIEEAERDLLGEDEIIERTSGRPRGDIPAEAEHITAFIDVHDKLLFWMATAWADDFTGTIIDYGTYPDQRRLYFSLDNARVSLRHKVRGAGKDGAILAGLRHLVPELAGRAWTREDGTAMQTNRVLIDSGYKPELVSAACRESDHPGVMPSRGLPIGARNKPLAEYRKNRGDRNGVNWRIPSARGTKLRRTVQFDANYWKSFVHARLAQAPGDRGCLTIYGRRQDRDRHRLLAQHIRGEYPTRTEGHGRVLDEWQPRPGAVDNHWLDCLVGCAVAASIDGAKLPGLPADKQARAAAGRKRVKLSALQRGGA